MSDDRSYPTKIDEALQPLRNLDEYGFGYGSGIPLPYQYYIKDVNKAILTILEAYTEILKNLSSPTTKTENP